MLCRSGAGGHCLEKRPAGKGGIADRALVESTLVYRLAPPLEIEDPTWIRPGKVAWDWWNANNVYGVDFKSGVNTATYKYYIDHLMARTDQIHLILGEPMPLLSSDTQHALI